jgi:hypothetical protein
MGRVPMPRARGWTALFVEPLQGIGVLNPKTQGVALIYWIPKVGREG